MVPAQRLEGNIPNILFQFYCLFKILLTNVSNFYSAGLVLLGGLFSSCGEWVMSYLLIDVFNVQSSHCGGFSYCGEWAQGPGASVVVVDWLGSCGSRL